MSRSSLECNRFSLYRVTEGAVLDTHVLSVPAHLSYGWATVLDYCGWKTQWKMTVTHEQAPEH